jgi:hypothetical protein
MRPRSALASATIASVFMFATYSLAQFKRPTDEVPRTLDGYLAKIRTAAPPNVVNNATITRTPPDGLAQVIQSGTNGYTCFVGSDGTPECDDANALEWRKALWAKQTPPGKIGFIYMLGGDTGTSNHDSSQRSTHQHWVTTGPHVMLVGGATKEVLSAFYPRDLDVKDPSQPFIMFPGQPNEHLMIPVHMEPLGSQ